jgi:hypothetical protein
MAIVGIGDFGNYAIVPEFSAEEQELLEGKKE